MTNIKNKILNIVESNKVTMIPKWKFVLYSVLGVFGLLFSFLTLVFFASLAVFLLSTAGLMYMPLFGLKATAQFLMSLPMLFGAIAIILLFVTEALARKHEFAFKKPIAITLLLITTISIIVSFFLSRTPFHFMLRNYMREHHTGMMKTMYDRPLPFADIEGMTVLKGTILETGSDTLQVQLFDETIIMVRATGTFPLPEFLEIGKSVILFGIMNATNTFEAVQVRPLGQGKGRAGEGRGMMREINQLPR
ncbi:MAG: hypothetical protein QG653_454 [Patescibacteria group bacterium]|nr:hypothetical protein [Patescibacteria group bacterium]